MATFRSEVFPDFFSKKINYSDKILFIGSCFAENIGTKLYELKFQIHLNPFGIIYNPVTIKQSLEFILNGKEFKPEDLDFYNEKWISFKHHGKFSSTNASEVLQNINDELLKASEYIKQASHLFITFGTSWVYKLKKTSEIVANCHKLPANEFEHYSLSVAEIKELYSPLLKKLHQANENLKIIFTISPVRHWKDGPVQNQYSKSVLIVSVHELIKEFNFASYFPSYEIMMDDLRDYRFYSEDLFHPNQMGIDYIWGKFKECYLSADAIELSVKIEKIIKSAKHQVLYPKTLMHKKFIVNSMNQIYELQKKYPYLSFANEYEYFKNEIQLFSND
jgi:hypothetical protein